MYILDDGALYMESEDILVVADVHLGARKQTEHSYPEPADDMVLEKIKRLIDKFNPSTIIFNGDTFTHTVPPEEQQEVIHKILSYSDYTSIFTIGNHEQHTKNITEFVDADYVTKEQKVTNTIFCHGHTTSYEKAPRYVIGHLHPAVPIHNTATPCYLYSNEEMYDVLVLPAFNPAIKSTPVRSEKLNSTPLITNPVSELKYALYDENPHFLDDFKEFPTE